MGFPARGGRAGGCLVCGHIWDRQSAPGLGVGHKVTKSAPSAVSAVMNFRGVQYSAFWTWRQCPY